MGSTFPDKSRPHYAGRWICQMDARLCDGSFVAKDVGVYPCPLAAKCKGSTYPLGQLEYGYEWKWGRLQCSTAERDAQRRLHLFAARSAFCPERLAANAARFRRRHAEDLRNAKRNFYPNMRDIPGYIPPKRTDKVPPCGGDCRNCPYNSCQYPHWDDGKSKPYNREAGRAAYARYKQRLKEDPDLMARYNASKKRSAEKFRAKQRYVKQGGDPNEFERVWNGRCKA